MFGLTVKRLVIIAVIAAVALTASQYVPPYVAHYQIENDVEQIVRFAAASRRTQDQIRHDVIAAAKEQGVVIGPDDISIDRDGATFTLSFAYEWPVDMRAFQQTLTFHVSANGETFGP